MRLVLALVLLAIAATASAGDRAPALGDRVVIEKAKRTLTVYSGARRLARFYVALGKDPVGRKLCQGDNRTPEGLYYVSGRKEKSDFHRALRLSYPSEADLDRAREAGCEPGGDIMIHGLKEDWGIANKLHRRTDWTRGCVAVTNEEIEELWALLPDGVAVEIRP